LKFISCATNGIVFDERVCDLVPEFNEQLRQQIRNISSDAQKIIDFVVNGEDRGVTYRELSYFVDRFGSRLSGSRNLEDAIDYMVQLLNTEGHKVHTEEVAVPKWVRLG
jgi:carboxypeptidase Q